LGSKTFSPLVRGSSNARRGRRASPVLPRRLLLEPYESKGEANQVDPEKIRVVGGVHNMVAVNL